MNIVSEVTSGIKVSVETFFQPAQSRPQSSHYVFAYRITLTNEGEFTMQLKRRHWFISDSNGTKREVKGEGVVGEQPILEPGQTYQYISGCNFHTEMGKMHGNYFFERILDGETLIIKIPEIIMQVPYKAN